MTVRVLGDLAFMLHLLLRHGILCPSNESPESARRLVPAQSCTRVVGIVERTESDENDEAECHESEYSEAMRAFQPRRGAYRHSLASVYTGSSSRRRKSRSSASPEARRLKSRITGAKRRASASSSPPARAIVQSQSGQGSGGCENQERHLTHPRRPWKGSLISIIISGADKISDQ